MKVALIPPIPELDFFGYGQFHLLLAHLLRNNTYLQHYRKQREMGAYLVLDNSAHEGKGDSADKLLQLALATRAQEVVVPDVLFKANETVEGAIQAHEIWFEGDKKTMGDLNPSLMYVPQGDDVDDWCECLKYLLGIHMNSARKYEIRRSPVIGISKDYEMWDGGILALIKHRLIPILQRHDIRYRVYPKVHLLGWGRNLWALKELASECSWIRSTDSAKPFVYAANEIELNSDLPVPEYPKRSINYFTTRLTTKQRRTAAINVSVFTHVAKGTE